MPAESIKKPAFGSLDAKIPSAKGERQILPKQTMSIFILIFSRKNPCAEARDLEIIVTSGGFKPPTS